MNRTGAMAICGTLGAFFGASAVANYYIANQTTACFQALAIIPAVLFGAPAGLALGIGFGYSIATFLPRRS